MGQRKFIANAGFFVAETAVVVLGLSANPPHTWLTYGLMLFTCAAVFVASVANYADGLEQGAENMRKAMTQR